MAPVLGIRNTRFSNSAFLIGTIVYIKFGLSRSCLFMWAGGEGYNHICIYSNTFGMTITKSISIRMVGKISLR